MCLKYVSEDTYIKEIEEKKGLVILEFWALWNAQSNKLTPLLEKLAKNYCDKVKFAQINIDECPNLVKKFSVVTIPTVIFMEDNKVITKEIGTKSQTIYNSHIEHLIENYGGKK